MKLRSLNTPPSVAPLISGLLLIQWTWTSIFWFLSATSSVVLLAILLFLPETRAQFEARSLRSTIFNRPIFPLLCSPRTPPTMARSEYPRVDGSKGLPNPFSGLKLLTNRGTTVAVICYSMYYMIYSCLQASLSTIFVEVYAVPGLIAGLSYMPFGLACVAASSLAGTVPRLSTLLISLIPFMCISANVWQAKFLTMTTEEQANPLAFRSIVV